MRIVITGAAEMKAAAGAIEASEKDNAKGERQGSAYRNLISCIQRAEKAGGPV